jgi:hypothetical protein
MYAEPWLECHHACSRASSSTVPVDPQIEQILIDVLVRENVQGPLNAATTPTAQMAAVTCTQCGYLMLFSLMQLDLHDL